MPSSDVIYIPAKTISSAVEESTASVDKGVGFQDETQQSLLRVAEYLIRILNHQRIITGLEQDKGDEF